MKNIKRSRLIIMAIAFTLLVAISAVVVIMATPSATFDGIQVATDGKINLRFYYTITSDDVKTATAVISDANMDPQKITVELETNEQGQTYFSVPLAAAQMGCQVAVTPLTSGGIPACSEVSYSVRDYAEMVLDEEAAEAAGKDYTEYYAAIKSILNYGTYASDYFSVNNGGSIVNTVVENEGMFSRDTNPVINMGYELKTATYKEPTVSNSDVSDAYYELQLGSSIELRLYFTYTGDSAVEGVRVGNTDQYYVWRGNISTEDYAQTINLVADIGGVEAVSVSTSVLECLQVLAGSDDTRDIAHAMYYYYLNTSINAPARTDCTHKRMHYEAVTLGSEYSQATCSFCGEIMSAAVHDSINYYSAPGQQFNQYVTSGNGSNCVQTGTLEKDSSGNYYNHISLAANASFEFVNGTIATPVRGYAVNGYKDANHAYDEGDKISGGTGRYFVFKIRTSNIGTLRVIANATDDNGGNASFDQGVGKSMGTMADFAIYVVDIASLGYSNYGAGLDAERACVAMCVGASGDSIDVAYFAICDDWTEVQSVVGEDTTVMYSAGWSNTVATAERTSLGTCVGGCTARKLISFSDGTYTYGCTGCNNNQELAATMSANVSGVNYFSAPGQYYNAWNAGGNGNSLCTMAGTIENVGGVVYQHIPLYASAYFEFTNGSITPVRGLSINGYHNSTSGLDIGDTVSGGTGNYFVIKIKGENVDSLSWWVNATNDGGATTSSNNPYVNRLSERAVTSEIKNEWMVYVVDIAKLGADQYPAGDTTAERIAVGLAIESSATGAEYLDIAYFAICDSWAEVKRVTGDETVKYIEGWKDVTAQDRNSDGTCKTHTVTLDQSTGAYSYTCTMCGEKIDEFTTDSSVNYYTAPGQFAHKNAWNTSLKSGVFAEDGVVFQRFNILGHGGTMPLTTAGHVNTGYFVNTNGGNGNYLVFKMKTHNVEALAWRISSASDTVAETNPSGNYLAQRTDFVNDEWITYVVDIKNLLTLAPGITTYGQAGDASRTKISAGFMYGFSSESGAAVTDVYVDISYFALCDDWTEVANVVRDEDKVYYTNWANNDSLKERNPDGTCINGCSVAFTKDGSSYSYKCSVCGTVTAYTMDSSVNFYSAPGEYYNAWATHSSSFTSLEGKVKVCGALMRENGVVFSRIGLDDGAAFEFTNGTFEVKRGLGVNQTLRSDFGYDYGNTSTNGTGNYFVLKIRSNDISSMRLIVNDGQNETFYVGNNNVYQYSETSHCSDTWTVYVVDIAKLASSFYEAGRTDLDSISVGMQFGGASTSKTTDYVDVAYFAVCDEWAEVEKVVGDEQVLYTAWTDTTEDKKLKSDGTLLVDTEGDDAAKVIYEKSDDRMYVYVRSNVEGVDKYTRYEFIHLVDDSINYDCWKILDMSICDANLNKLYTTVQGASECEAALQEKTNYGTGGYAADFIGGYHGDEYLTSLKVLVDGVEIDMSKNYSLTACTSVQAVVESYLNRCNSDEKVFERVRTDTWTEQGLVINNKFTTVADIYIQRPATSMLAIAFKDGTITEHRNTNLDWTEIPDFQAQNASGITVSNAGVTWAEFRGKVNVRVEMTKYTVNEEATSPIGWFSYDYWGANARRVKIYIEPFNGKQLYVGDVFECTSVQSIFAAE